MFDSKHYPDGWEFKERNHRRSKLVEGVGVNDSPYTLEPTINGKQQRCPFYQKWRGMLSRSYSEAWHVKKPTYIDCSVCDEWKSFMAFRAWLERQMVNVTLPLGEVQLDKDLLTNSKQYGPETCLLVPSWLNNLILDGCGKRGDLPIGVCRSKKRFRALLNKGNGQENLGTYDTPEEASRVYLKAKFEHVQDVELPGWLPQKKIRRRLVDIVCKQSQHVYVPPVVIVGSVLQVSSRHVF